MIHISIPEEFVDQIEKSALEEAAAVALQVGLAEAIHLSEHEKPNTKETDLSIVIDNDSKLQELNLQFRNVNTPTDVLAFPAFEKDPETEHTYLGDVIISFPQALSQAQSSNHSVEAELQLLTVHGILHLLGYEHENGDAKGSMWNTQELVLRRLGAKINWSPDE